MLRYSSLRGVRKTCVIPIDFNVNTPTRPEEYTPDVNVTDNYDIMMTLPHSRLLNEWVCYPGPLLEVELESTCYQVRLYCLCI